MLEWTALLKPLGTLLPAARERWLQRRGPSIHVEERPLGYAGGWEVVTPARVRPIDGPPQLTDVDLRAWFIRNRAAVPARESLVALEMTGRSKAVTRVENIEAAIVSREPAYAGSHIVHESAGAGDAEHVYLDLDRPRLGPLLDRWPEDQPPSRPYFDRRSIQLSQQESVTVRVRAGASSSAYEWALRVTFRVGERQRGTWTPTQRWRTSPIGEGAERWTWRWWERSYTLVSWDDAV